MIERLRLRRIRRAKGVVIHPTTMALYPPDIRERLRAAGWELVVVSEHGIRQWMSADGECVTFGADCAEPEQVRYLYSVLSGERERRVPGALPDDALATLLALDADTIMRGDTHVDW